MPKHAQFIVHHKSDATSYSFPVESAHYEGMSIPDVSRKSTHEALIVHELQTIRTQQILLGHLPTAKEDISTLDFLFEKTYTYKAYNFFKADKASVETKQKPIEVKANSYDHGILGEPGRRFFGKIGALSDNTKTPEGYLSRYYELTAAEPLLHVRECEDMCCTLHPDASPYVKRVGENFIKQIVLRVLKDHPDKTKTIFYGGFASNLMLRDVKIIKALIDAGYKKFQLLFVDKAYANLCKQTGEEYGELKLAEEIDVKLQFKALQEVTQYLAANTECDEKSPLSVHIFSDVTQAIDFFKDKPDAEKLTLLVGQDYFVKDGCAFVKYATQEAHSDFMRLGRAVLGKRSCFFELVKKHDDIYFHAGYFDKGKYYPLFTNHHKSFDQVTMVYQYTSLGYLDGVSKDEPEVCGEGFEFIKYEKDVVTDGTSLAMRYAGVTKAKR